jgi:hypothetical protein
MPDSTHLSAATVKQAFSMRVNLGDTVAELQTPDTRWSDHLRTRFRGFLTTRQPHLVVRHRPDRAGPPVEYLPSGREFELNAEARTELIDGVLRTELPELAAPGLVVHGALLSDGERGYLCCGPSGAGKSTLAALFPEHALCDELALARKAGDSFDGISLPYQVARPGRVPLAGVFFIEHAQDHWRQRLRPSAAAREMSASICWPTRRSQSLRNAFTSLADLVNAVPMWRLGFAPDPGVWQTIVIEP